MTSAVFLTESDLHGLVDGQLDPSRRPDALRRLAASPADRARLGAWRDQNELIRSAFAAAEKEPVPPSLRLVGPPSLHFVPSDVAVLRAPQPTSKRRSTRRMIGGVFATLLIASGLVVSWALFQTADDAPQMVATTLRGSVDETLAAQADGALAVDRHKLALPARMGTPAPLPTTSIPDLSPSGFTFTNAESQPAEPHSLVFHYRGAGLDRVVVSVARTVPSGGDTAPARVGKSFTWHHGEDAFAIAGTVRPERLKAIATLLQGAEIDE